MMMRNFFLGIIVVVLLGCSREQRQDIVFDSTRNNVPQKALVGEIVNEGFLVNGPRGINIMGEIDTTVTWVQYKSVNNTFHFSVPDSWSLISKEGVEFLFALDTMQRDFFTLTANFKSDMDVSPKKYIEYMIDEVNSDQVRKIKVVGIEKYKNYFRDLYYIELLENGSVHYFVFITESDKYILDFTMKSAHLNPKVARTIFQWTMSSFLINDNSVIGLEANLENASIDVSY